MSSKQPNKRSNGGNLDTRVAPKEMIITRHKSALQKRQLRKKDRSMKTITQLLKGPPKSTPVPTVKPSKKVNVVAKSPQKEVEEDLEIEPKEFYPNKMKRKVDAKKIVLKPKHNMKVIAGTNKRKLCTPHRGMQSPPPFEPQVSSSVNEIDSEQEREENRLRSELSMAELIRMAEDTHSLDDEDLMEILTCPSPVWWEDPPDGYDEEPIMVGRLREPDNDETETSKSEVLAQKDKSTPKQIASDVNIENRDKGFQQKRSKLENLLGTIKKKVLNGEVIPPKKKTKVSPESNVDQPTSESTEEEVFSDVSMNEEEVLRDLASIEIPIESNCIKTETSVIKKEVITEVPKNMPQLKRRPQQSYRHQNLSTTTVATDIDSISDSNVRFIDEFVRPISNKRIAKSKEKNNTSESEENTVTVSKSIDQEIVSDLGLYNSDAEYITVYKIMSSKNDSTNNDSEEIEQPKQTAKKTKVKDYDSKKKLNLFFKKCKDNRRINKIKNQNEKTTAPVKELDKNSILVSKNNKHKYCYNCSSIFDTDECSYCVRKAKVQKCSQTQRK